VGQTLTGGTSGATAVIDVISEQPSRTSFFVRSVVGTFADGETVTGPAGSFTNSDIDPSGWEPFDGAIYVAPFVVNGAGASTEWTPSAGANWQCLDEFPATTADYISTTVNGNRDLYTFTGGTLINPSATVVGLAPTYLFSSNLVDGVDTFLGIVRNTGSGDEVAAEPPYVTTSYQFSQVCFGLNEDGNGWGTGANVLANYQLGIEAA
jgi:hypothetical protein